MFINGESGSKVKIDIIERELSECDDYWDSNWLNAYVEVIVPGFKAEYKACLRVNEFQEFYKDLMEFNKLAIKEIEFTTMEQGIYLKFNVNKLGVVTCSGSAWDGINDNTLEFTFNTDLISMDKLALQIQAILIKYPLVGKRS